MSGNRSSDPCLPAALAEVCGVGGGQVHGQDFYQVITFFFIISIQPIVPEGFLGVACWSAPASNGADNCFVVMPVLLGSCCPPELIFESLLKVYLYTQVLTSGSHYSLRVLLRHSAMAGNCRLVSVGRTRTQVFHDAAPAR